MLEHAEEFYLYAHGWERDEDGFWTPPATYPFKRRSGYSHGHAVNAQKQATYNPMHGGERPEPSSSDES